MATFIIYAIRWAVTLTLLYSLYRLLLQRETFHRLNRAVLLAILVVSPLLPLIPLHTDDPTTFDEVLAKIEGSCLACQLLRVLQKILFLHKKTRMLHRGFGYDIVRIYT